jgi:hypothetical protein
MKHRFMLGLVTGIGMSVGNAPIAHPQTILAGNAIVKETPTMTRASGTFTVKLTPQAITDDGGGLLGRMSVDKQFSGDLQGTSKGEMLSAMTAVQNSAGYVAIERVTGTLHGRRGSFVLQHSGTMTRGAPGLTISVVPDSGTDELAGLNGTMTITITEGRHFYEFEYTLPTSP